MVVEIWVKCINFVGIVEREINRDRLVGFGGGGGICVNV